MSLIAALILGGVSAAMSAAGMGTSAANSRKTQELQNEMNAYLAENPNADMSDYQNRIDLAQGLLTRYDPASKTFIGPEAIDLSGNRRLQRIADRRGWGEDWGDRTTPQAQIQVQPQPQPVTPVGNISTPQDYLGYICQI